MSSSVRDREIDNQCNSAGGGGHRLLHYRTYCNFDPPGIVEVWNEAFAGRGAVQLKSAAPLEKFVFAKPYFDPAGLIIACDGPAVVGFAHCGFGPNKNETALATATGVICMLGVRSSHRGRGVGSGLLERSMAYLRTKGARQIYAGQARPLTPFYWGLYGGSDFPGFLASDAAAAPFFEYQGFGACETMLVFQRRLEASLDIVDVRFAAFRRRFNVRSLARTEVGSWWEESVLGPLEPIEFRVEDTVTNRLVALADVWEMEGFSWRWGVPSAGIIGVTVRDDMRRQGIGKYLLMHVLRYLQEQYFGIVEIQVSERNQSAVRLCQSLGFEQVDFGRQFRFEH